MERGWPGGGPCTGQYSAAMKANKAAWTPSSLDTYLADPRGEDKDVLQGNAGGQGSRRRHRLFGDSKIGTGLILLRHNNRTGAIHGLAGLCRWL